LSKHGKVLEQGSYAELMNNEKGEVTRLLSGVAPSRRSIKEDKPSKTIDPSKTESSTPGKETKKLMTTEERQTGSVQIGVYLKYIHAGGGYILFALVFSWYLVSAGVNLMSSLWLSIWTADSSYVRQSESFYIVGYALTALLMGIVTFIRTYGLASLVFVRHSLYMAKFFDLY